MEKSGHFLSCQGKASMAAFSWQLRAYCQEACGWIFIRFVFGFYQNYLIICSHIYIQKTFSQAAQL